MEKEIMWYGQIEITNPDTKEKESKNIYSKMNEKGEVEFYIEEDLIATVIEQEENRIEIVPKYQKVITPEIFLAKMNELRQRNKQPISLDKLEKIRQERLRQENREQEIGKARKNQAKRNEKRENKLQEKERDKKQDSDKEKQKQQTKGNYIEISMKQYITADKKIVDLIPELKQKQCERVIVKSNNNISFNVYGIDRDGNEIELQTLRQTEGKNPSQKIIATNLDGTNVQQTTVSTMLKIQQGTNEQKGNEALGIKIGELGIEEIYYCRRDKNDNYLAVQVGLETTNDKYSTREVRELATKRYNPTIDDNTKKAKSHIQSGDDKTIIENIDDTPQNDKIEPYEIELIKEAAQRCKVTIEEFLETYQKTQRRYSTRKNRKY